MRPYSELNALKPEAFLHWEDFQTEFDTLDANIARQEENWLRGLEVGAKSTYVFIACNSTWGARGKDGSQTTSYEGIGYHAGAAYFWKGVLDSGVPIKVYRSGPSETWIKGSEAEAESRKQTA